MKKIIIAMAAMAAFSMASCNKEPFVEQKADATAVNGKCIITAFTESSLTRTALRGDDADGYDVVWSDGDEITVGGYGGNVYHIYEGIGTTSATFLYTGSGSGSLSDGEYDSFYRMYDKTLPVRQVYSEGRIKSSPMHAKVTISGGKPRPAQFHNLCGLLRLKLKEKTTGDNIEVSKITIRSAQPMSGKFDIVDYAAVMKTESVSDSTWLDCTEKNVELTTDGVDFYIALPAGTYSNVVVEVADQNGSVCTKRLASAKTLTIERSRITPASFAVKGDEFIPCNLEAVDLGLSVLWANMNVGAISPANGGYYFAWGETSGKSVYSQDYYFDPTYTKYTASGKTVLDPEDDAAHVIWGGNWRMPTKDEFAELFDADKTEWSFINSYGENINGVMCYNGMKITSKTTGKSIFLKSEGYYTGTGFNYPDSGGLYWSSTVSGDFTGSAFRLKFSYPFNSSEGYHERHDVSSISRYYGLTVRPVCSIPAAK